MNKQFINFDVKSYYSLLKSTISIDDLIAWNLKQNNSIVLLIDDSMSSCIEFYNKAINNHLKPVIGLNIKYQNNEFLLIARNNDGYHKLLKISSLDKTNQDYKLDSFLNNNDLIIILINGSLTFNDTYFYKANELAINKVRYLNQEDFQIYCALKAIKNETKLSEINFDSEYYLLTYEQALKYFDEELINKTNQLINECNWTIEFNQYQKTNQLNFPKFDCGNLKPNDYLKNLCLYGLETKFNNHNINKVYIDRLMYELSIIEKMNLNDYFLVVWDFIKFAKNNKIRIGPGRGSAAGSLVSFALDITEIDPIKNNLIFERFLNINRNNLPDIDIDVMDTKRDQLINYIFDKYGINNVSFIATYQRIKSKMAIRDVGRILGIDIPIVDKISKLMIDDESIDLENSEIQYYYNKFPELFQIATNLINIPRNISTHAAGIVLSNQDITNFYAVQSGIDNLTLSQLTMEYLECLDLVKIDILGLKNLSIIQTVIDMVYENKNQKLNLNMIDLNDKNLFYEIANANTVGIFQLESFGMRSTLKKIKPKSIEDISITSAFYRPGPQAFIDDYVKTRNGLIPPNYLNEKLKPILEPTLGFIIYQEQVMEVIRNITNFSMSQADIFRRAISKKKIDLFSKMQEEFIQAGLKNGYDKNQLDEIYNHLLNFAKYGFNHSHSLSYAYISYQMMFLKYYYPLEFCLTLLIYVSANNDKNLLYINEAKRYQIKIMNVNIKYSDINFSNYQNQILFGFMNIKGIGFETAKKIVNIRNQYLNENVFNLIKALHNNKVDQRSIETLIKVGAFDDYGIDRLILLKNIEIIFESIWDSNQIEAQLLLWSKATAKMSEIDKSKCEKDYLGYSFSNNVYQLVFNKSKTNHNLSIFDFKTIDTDANYLIFIQSAKKIITKYKQEMFVLNVLIDENIYEIYVHYNEKTANYYQVNNYLSVNLKANNYKLSITKVNEIIDVN